MKSLYFDQNFEKCSLPGATFILNQILKNIDQCQARRQNARARSRALAIPCFSGPRPRDVLRGRGLVAIAAAVDPRPVLEVRVEGDGVGRPNSPGPVSDQKHSRRCSYHARTLARAQYLIILLFTLLTILLTPTSPSTTSTVIERRVTHFRVYVTACSLDSVSTSPALYSATGGSAS